MDLTNARSLEIFCRLGLAGDLGKIGFPSHIDQPTLMSSALASDASITGWDLPGVDRWREQIEKQNDGTQPLEPWQRLSQVVFQRWLKGLCDSNPLIDVRFGWQLEEVEEMPDKVRTLAPNLLTGESTLIRSECLGGCDGGSSRTRKSLDLPLDGGPIRMDLHSPSCALLVHFKSRDLTRIHKQGQFWHILLMGEPFGFGGAIIAQDEVDTWTTHLFVGLDVDTDGTTSEEAVYRVLGGLHEPYPIKIDKILVRSVWRPIIAVTRSWTGPHRRVFLAGDSAHQNIPTGRYGMNMGIADAYDLGWKIAAVVHGQGGRDLLESYEMERRPVALRNVERLWCALPDQTPEAQAVRAKIHDHYQKHQGENKDLGIEMGYRYHSPVIVIDSDDEEPEWSPSCYTPTTWPGSRPPHVFLSDGRPIFDLLGPHWTLLSFSDQDISQQLIEEAAASFSVPLTHVDLSKESVARDLYEKDLVLIRPDQHVAWRRNGVGDAAQAQRILAVVTRRPMISNDHISNGAQ